MKCYKQEWLPHLKNAIPPEAKRNRISLYTIALEGYRRGLNLKFLNTVDEVGNNKLVYALSSGQTTHYFHESSGDLNTEAAQIICDNKSITYSYLQEANVPTPKGKTFTKQDSIEKMIAYAEQLRYPLVVKPIDGSGGRGVFANIKNEQQLKHAISRNFNQLKYESIIIQQFIMGDEVRIYVLEDQVLSATHRMPANVVGDGKQSIMQLIREKNELRKDTPHLYHRPIKVDNEVKQFIQDQNYTFDSVLKNNERVFLSKVSNISSGGDPVDITNDLTETQKNIAIEATKSIPGLTHSGVDMIINHDTTESVVLEVNMKPGIGSHLFPIQGQAVDIPKKIMDYYFPETIDWPRNTAIYFNLQTVFDAFSDGMLTEIDVTPPPSFPLKTMVLDLITPLGLEDTYEKIIKYIKENRIHGNIYQEQVNKISIVAAHEKSEALVELVRFLKERKGYFQIEHIKKDVYDKPVKVGFEILGQRQSMGSPELEAEYKQIIKNNKQSKKEIQRLEKKINQMLDSTSWRITTPLRAIIKKIKRK